MNQPISPQHLATALVERKLGQWNGFTGYPISEVIAARRPADLTPNSRLIRELCWAIGERDLPAQRFIWDRPLWMNDPEDEARLVRFAQSLVRAAIVARTQWRRYRDGEAGIIR